MSQAITDAVTKLERGLNNDFCDTVVGMSKPQLQRLETALLSGKHPVPPQARDWALALVNSTLDTLAECR